MSPPVDAFAGHLVVSYRGEALSRIQLWPIDGSDYGIIDNMYQLGAATDGDLFFRKDARPRFSVSDENATVSINYT